MKQHEHLEQLFDRQYHSDMNSGISRALTKSKIDFGFAANRINLAFEKIKPFHDPVLFKISSNDRREIICAVAFNAQEQLRSLIPIVIKSKDNPPLNQLGFKGGFIKSQDEMLYLDPHAEAISKNRGVI
jgi:hypothetical protein